MRVRGVEVRDGRFDAWIERDDPRPLGRIGEVEAWRFPSYFTPRSNVDRSSVSSLACGHRVDLRRQLRGRRRADSPLVEPGADARRALQTRDRGPGQRHRRGTRILVAGSDAGSR